MTSMALTPRETVGEPRLRMMAVSKRYGGVRAIRHADFELMEGEVHALVGENGAGKSTLIKIIAGAETSDTGTMTFEGEEVTVRSASDAINLGIATVYQEAQLFGQLTVAENIFLGREITKGNRVDWAAQNELVVELLERIGLPARYSSVHVEKLSTAEQQQVSIAKALAGEAKILILDEPSAILTDAEIETLYQAVRSLTASGVAIIYITHRLDELFEIADVVTVMRDGTTLGTYDIADLTVGSVAELLVGEGFTASEAVPQEGDPGELVLELEGLASGQAFHAIDLTVSAGEVVVLYGLVGSGTAEVANSVYGMRPTDAGIMRLKGQTYSPNSAEQAQAARVAMVPANRKLEGLFSFQPISFNISVGHLGLLRKLFGWMDVRQEREMANNLIRELAIKTPSAAQKVSNLSGGNAQKVVMGRALAERPTLLVLSEPSQGVDIGAKEEIYRIVEQLCADGAAVLVASSDLGEAIRIADRLVVMRNGEIFTTFGPNARQSDVLAAASGARLDEEEHTAGGVTS